MKQYANSKNASKINCNRLGIKVDKSKVVHLKHVFQAFSNNNQLTPNFKNSSPGKPSYRPMTYL